MNSTIPSYILDKRADELLKQRDFDFPGKLNPNERDEERKQDKKIAEYNRKKDIEEKQNEIYNNINTILKTWIKKTIDEKEQQENENQIARKNDQNRKHELLATIKSGVYTRVAHKLNGISYSDFEDDYIVWLWNNIVKSKKKNKESQKDKELKRKMSELIGNEMKNRNLPTQGDDFEKMQMSIDPERRKLFIKWAGGYI